MEYLWKYRTDKETVIDAVVHGVIALIACAVVAGITVSKFPNEMESFGIKALHIWMAAGFFFIAFFLSAATGFAVFWRGACIHDAFYTVKVWQKDQILLVREGWFLRMRTRRIPIPNIETVKTSQQIITFLGAGGTEVASFRLVVTPAELGRCRQAIKRII